jgi:hypothetical protein
MFRLLDLSPSRDPEEPLRGAIRTVNVDFIEHAQAGPKWNDPRWTALSYVWTDPDDPTPVTLDGQTLLDPKKSEEILIGNTSLMITPNLFQALMLIRGYKYLCTIWVDQICIDQSNLQERASQIGLMSMIFSAAERVLVWLGKAIRSQATRMLADTMAWLASTNRSGSVEGAPPEARYAMKLMESDPKLCPPPNENHHLFVKEMAKDILEDPWFSRAWVVQEAVFARNLRVYLGPVIAPWNMFEKALSGLSYWSIPWSTDEDSEVASYHRIGLQMITKTRDWQESRYQGALKPSAKLSTLLLGLRVTQATDGRDKVYSFWHLSEQVDLSQKGLKAALPITYEKGIQGVYGHTVGYCINSETTLDIISCTCQHERSRQDTLFPSWMHDWRATSFNLTCSTDIYNILPQRGCDAYTQWSESNGKTPFNASGGILPQAGTRSEASVGFSLDFSCILLSGIVFDVIEVMSGRACTTTPGVQTKADQDHNWRVWASLAMEPVPGRKEPYGPPGARFDALWKALTFGGVKIPGKSDEQIAEDFREWWSAGRPIESPAHADWSQRLDTYETFKEQAFPNGLYADNRRLFRTHRGYIGTACEHAKPDDLVCILWGGALPFILRQTDIDDDRPYHIVGGATYVHGIMFGEALKIAEQEEIPEQEFWIA